ncbi:hypothetical protein [Dankookia sp. P2]|uniref:hypothetical protein n=1 Tax=Dankookia sp. P2 TaxID=3423955 RepID=UPI003D678C57
MTLGGKAAVTGIGETDYTRDAGGRGVLTLQLEASLAALADAGLRPAEIDGIVMPIGLGATVAEDLVTNLGIPDLRFSTTTPLGGAGAVAAVQCAAAAVAAGLCRHVLLPLGRTGRTGSRIGARIHQMPQFRTVGRSRHRSVPWPRRSTTRRWRGGIWSSSAPPAGSWPRSR